MIIIAGSSHPELAKTIANKLSVPLIIAQTKKFEDQELRVQLDGQLYEQDIVIIQSTSKPANDHLMELLLLADTAKHAGARRITAVIPYFGYSRQDRPSYSYGPISASLVSTLLEASGIDRVLTLDLHSKQIEGFFKIGVQNFDSLQLFSPSLKNKENHIIVSPDIGGITRAEKFADMLGLELAVINKKRTSEGKCIMNNIIGDIKGKNCIIIDDIIDTGGTLISACELLLQKQAKSVSACITHGVFSGSCLKNIEESPIKNFYITNSIEQTELPKKIKVISISDIFVDALQDLTRNKPYIGISNAT
jgi:ribose-phosphate pyrophosphokinase